MKMLKSIKNAYAKKEKELQNYISLVMKTVEA